MSEETWPNWNLENASWPADKNSWTIHVWRDVAQLKQWIPFFTQLLHFAYPCLKRRGPIETSPSHTIVLVPHSLSMSAKTWPNWNQAFGPESARHVWSIHDWEVVAQLKLVRRRDVAQLKLRFDAFINVLNSFYPCLKGRGPIAQPLIRHGRIMRRIEL